MSKRLCIAATALLAGCAAGPDYHRPSLDVPPQYRDTAPATTGASRINNEDQVQILASYQLDLWGQLRRMNEAARANLLASQYARRAVSVTLVATLANANLRSRDARWSRERSLWNLRMPSTSVATPASPLHSEPYAAPPSWG
jgi:outer membrane protein TolC